MAVGYWFRTTPAKSKTLAESWNGTSYQIVHTPNPGASDDQLYGISCSSVDKCFAVGEAVSDTDSENVPHLLVAMWNGSVWAPNVLAHPPSADQGGLVSVSCPATTGCMAVGWTDGSKGTGAVAEQWDGSAWTSESLPSGTDDSAEAESVSCTSTTACEAAGAVVHTWAANWNGPSWSLDQTVEQPGVAFVFGTSCTKSGGCAAVGVWEPGGTSYTDAEHT